LILLDGVHLGEFTLLDKLYLEKFSEATNLSLSMTGLQNLKNLPHMPNLQTLDLSDNALTGEDLNMISQAFVSLRVLRLANNMIGGSKQLENVAQLNKCQAL